MGETEPEVLLVRLVGVQDRAAAAAIRDQMVRQISTEQTHDVTLDFADAAPLNLFGLGAVPAISAEAKRGDAWSPQGNAEGPTRGPDVPAAYCWSAADQ